MRCLLTILVCVTPLFAIGQENLGAKVVRVPLNQEQPSVIKLGIHGITTIEFPMKIEALDGYGFSLNPAPDGQDFFQISFNKGTNFISLKAIRPGAEGNLSVVLDGKVYALLCNEEEHMLIVNDLRLDKPNKSWGSITDSITRLRISGPEADRF